MKTQYMCVVPIVILATLCMEKGYAQSNNFICINGEIINFENICDGIADCSDGSDEIREVCYHSLCPPGMFRCQYGACVSIDAKCDGRFDCLDKSDESQCGHEKDSCESTQFRCGSGECLDISLICDGLENCIDGSDESTDICEELPCPKESFRCTIGGCVHQDARCDGIPHCLDASDEASTLCEILACSGSKCEHLHNVHKCPPVDISRIEATCFSSYGKVPCDNPVPLGTKIHYQCKDYFVPVDRIHENNAFSQCQFDGKWSREPLRCRPDCGKLDYSPVPLVWNGWDTNKVIYPWHATMYHYNDGKWNVWCGGTLITENVVLTAGHCVWNQNKTILKLAFGKYYSDFDKEEDNSQVRDVKEIITQSLYQDRNGNYGSDLSLLVLDKPVQLSSSIHPACVDWNLSNIKHQLHEGNLGLVVGMGVTESEEFSEVLKGVRIPVAPNEKCITDEVPDFRKYITYNVICAGWKNGTGVCNGDSGGGLLFPMIRDPSRWVIQGLVSISPRKLGTSFCDPTYYTVFTKVGIYLPWIHDVLIKINQSVR